MKILVLTKMGVQVWLCMCFLLHCTLHATSYSGKLLYSTYSLIKEFDFDTRNVTVLLDVGKRYVFAMDYDYKNRFMYFTRYNIYDIVRFPYPSKNITLHTVIQTDSLPTGLAVDSTNDHIYWVHQGSQRLLRCNIDGSNMTVLSTLRYPWVIRLDVTNRWIYIVERDFGVLKSTFNSAHQHTIVNFTSAPNYCMDIDTEEQRLYWINNNGDMKSAKDDDSDVKTIYSTYDRRDYPALDAFGSYIYYDHTNQYICV